MKRERPALLVRVLTAIGAERIVEGWIADEAMFVHGETNGRTIRINPAVDIVDTLIHETLHRLQPEWSERYIRNRTTWLLRRMSDEQIQQLFAEYQRLAKRRARGRRAAQATSGTDSGGVRSGLSGEVRRGTGTGGDKPLGRAGDAGAGD